MRNNKLEEFLSSIDDRINEDGATDCTDLNVLEHQLLSEMWEFIYRPDVADVSSEKASDWLQYLEIKRDEVYPDDNI